MFKALTPIFAILIAFGLVVTHIQPSFVAIQAMERETEEYQNALEHANALQAEIDAKLERKRSFDQTDLLRLSQMIPTEIDEVGTILSLDELARRHSMKLSNIEVFSPKDEGVEASDNVSQPRTIDPDMPIDPSLDVMEDTRTPLHTDISFAVQGTYGQFKDFMTDLEDSLALGEVMELTFDSDEGDLMLFTLTVRFFSYNSTE